MELSAVLAEFALSTADNSERSTFFATLSSSPEMQLAIFNAVQLDDSRFKPENVSPLLRMLLLWLRSLRAADGNNECHLVLQYLPHLITLNLAHRRSTQQGKKASKELDAFLLSVYNQEVADESGDARERSFQIQGIARSSIYHDGSRVVDAQAGFDQDSVNIRDNGLLKLSPNSTFRQAKVVNSQNRLVIVEALFKSFNSVLGELSRSALDQYVRCTQKLLQRGYKASHHQRIQLSSNILLELLHGAYFCIYNGFQPAGGAILELIRQRGAAVGSPQVLLTVNAIRTLVLNSGPSQLPATSITTPSQIAKNLITNASFRAKKMGDDIPKVAVENVTAESSAIANNLKVLANMGAISEEIVEEVIDRTPTKGHKEVKATKDKLRPKIPGFKKRTAVDGEKDHDKVKSGGGLEHKKQDSKKKEAATNPVAGDSMEMTKLTKEKRKDKVSRTLSTSEAVAPPPPLPPPAAPTFQPVMASEVDSMEQIEALIKNKRLPAETVTIHSPESGTTIF